MESGRAKSMVTQVVELFKSGQMDAMTAMQLLGGLARPSEVAPSSAAPASPAPGVALGGLMRPADGEVTEQPSNVAKTETK